MSRFKVKDNNDQWVDISANGVGVPSGGTQGQVLAKRSGTSYDAGWVNPSGGVHVGPTAPTDAFTTIWLDTDEQGMSAVSSVNGKTGTVVIDTVPMTLLWTNASPTSNFAAQTVPLDLSGYDLIVMTVYFSKVASYVLPALICELGETAYFTTVDSGNAQYWRTAKPQSTGVVYSRGVISGADHNDALIPYQIWGIKLS